MKYLLVTDNSVQWFTYLVCVAETGEVLEEYSVPTCFNNAYINNLYNRGVYPHDIELNIRGCSVNRFCGNNISEYEYQRVRRMLELFPQVKEYERLGQLEPIH